MGKYMDTILSTEAAEVPNEHPDLEELALFAEGNCSPEQRKRLMNHLLQCHDCYDIVIDAIRNINEKQGLKKPHSIQKPLYAFAASILLILGIGIAALFGPSFEHKQHLAYVELDTALQNLLSLNEKTTWEDADRIKNLKLHLKKQGIDISQIKEVAMIEPYGVSTGKDLAKSLFGPKQKLELRIEGNKLYLKVINEEQTP